jgi:hypothetical protein
MPASNQTHVFHLSMRNDGRNLAHVTEDGGIIRAWLPPTPSDGQCPNFVAMPLLYKFCNMLAPMEIT